MRLLFLKGHVQGYARQDGTPVRPYERQQHGAPPVASFRSGASAPADFRGYMDAGVPVGVSLAEVSPESSTWPMMVAYASKGGQIFVDSGAFTAFTQGQAVDWTRVLGLYQRLASEVAGRGRLHFVAPDIVGDQAGSLRLLAEHAPELRALMAAGHDVLVPVQKGELAPYRAWQEAARILGTDDFSVAVPSNKVAFGPQDMASLFGGEHKPPRAHLLGVAGDKALLGKLVRDIHTRSPGTAITSDANRIRAKVGEGRPITAGSKRAVQAGSPWGEEGLDLTELMARIALDPGWLRPDQVRGLAAGMGVDDPAEQARWVAAHAAGDLADLLDDRDPDGRMTEHAIRQMFRREADQRLRSGARSAAIAEDELRAAAQHDLFGHS